MPTALITGVTGQDGSYLAELLLGKGYEVHGTMRRSSTFNTSRIDHLYKDPHEHPDTRFRLHYCDVTDASGLRAVIEKTMPDEVYNLAAQSHVRVSFDQPTFTAEVTAIGAMNVLEAVRDHCHSRNRKVRIYQASSSEMFGSSPPPQGIRTPFHPRSPYGCSKVFAYHATVNYREAYGLFACNGILFNHESPRRSPTFVTRKVTLGLTRIAFDRQKTLHLGNTSARRDWGHAKDYVRAMWMMLQAPTPGDYVIATGHSRSISDLLDTAYNALKNLGGQLPPLDQIVKIDPVYFRPSEVDDLRGEISDIERLGWKPEIGFEQMIEEMIQHDIDVVTREIRQR